MAQAGATSIMRIAMEHEVEPSSPSVTAEHVTRLIQEQSERDRKWLEFAQSQGEKDRAHFKHLFDRTYWFIAIVVAVVGVAGTILGVSSVQQIREKAELTVNTEIAKVQSELENMRSEIKTNADESKRKVQEELSSAHVEVSKRVDAEFRSENITRLVQDAAKNKTDVELAGTI